MSEVAVDKQPAKPSSPASKSKSKAKETDAQRDWQRKQLKRREEAKQNAEKFVAEAFTLKPVLRTKYLLHRTFRSFDNSKRKAPPLPETPKKPQPVRDDQAIFLALAAAANARINVNALASSSTSPAAVAALNDVSSSKKSKGSTKPVKAAQSVSEISSSISVNLPTAPISAEEEEGKEKDSRGTSTSSVNLPSSLDDVKESEIIQEETVEDVEVSTPRIAELMTAVVVAPLSQPAALPTKKNDTPNNKTVVAPLSQPAALPTKKNDTPNNKTFEELLKEKLLIVTQAVDKVKVKNHYIANVQEKSEGGPFFEDSFLAPTFRKLHPTLPQYGNPFNQRREVEEEEVQAMDAYNYLFDGSDKRVKSAYADLSYVHSDFLQGRELSSTSYSVNSYMLLEGEEEYSKRPYTSSVAARGKTAIPRRATPTYNAKPKTAPAASRTPQTPATPSSNRPPHPPTAYFISFFKALKNKKNHHNHPSHIKTVIPKTPSKENPSIIFPSLPIRKQTPRRSSTSIRKNFDVAFATEYDEEMREVLDNL